MLVSGQLPDMKPGLVSLLVGGGAALSLLGAGEGPLSCPAFPYRAALTSWPGGCPASRPCCDEYGYCRPEQEWKEGRFRDCNGLSNGNSIPDDVIKLEAFFAAIKSSALSFGPIGPIVIGNNGPIGGSGGKKDAESQRSEWRSLQVMLVTLVELELLLLEAD